MNLFYSKTHLNNIKCMKNQTLFFNCVLSTFLILASCNKQVNLEPNNIIQNGSITPQLLVASKTFFDSAILKTEAETKLIPNTTLSKGVVDKKLPQDRMKKLSKNINWEGAFKVNLREKSFLFVPVNESINPFLNKNFEFIRYLIFESQTTNISNLTFIELLSDSGSSLNNAKQMTISAFLNILQNTSNPLVELNASVIFYNQKYVRLQSYHVNNGQWQVKRISFRSDLEIKL